MAAVLFAALAVVGCAPPATIPRSFGADCHRRYVPPVGEARDVTLTIRDGLYRDYDLRVACVTIDADGTVLETDGTEIHDGLPAIRRLRVTPGEHTLVFHGLWRQGRYGFDVKSSHLVLSRTADIELESYEQPSQLREDRPKVRWREDGVATTNLIFLRAVQFAVGSAEIPPGEVPHRRDVARTLGGHPELTSVALEAHADPREADGVALSGQRAKVLATSSGSTPARRCEAAGSRQR